MMPVTGTLTVGREHADPGMVVGNDAGMSRAHFRLVCVPGVDGVRLEDGNSKNGTFVNGRRVASDFLSNGAVIRAGESLFVFSELPREASNWLDCVAASTGDADSQVSLARAYAEAQGIARSD
jgi:pSer/pThr/pTyr-binding forkhead associated (FHA) protein